MIIRIKRKYLENTITGEMFIDGKFVCLTLERKDKAIPEGTYDVEMRESPKFGLTPWIRGVPNRRYILIHPGNHANFRTCDGKILNDTEGCILTGTEMHKSNQFIYYSKVGFQKMMSILMKNQEKMRIEIY